MPAIFEYRYQVTAADIDGQGHVNNLCYLRWMQEAAVAHSREQGWSGPRYRETGASWVARSHTIEYLKPAFQDDEIVVRTWVSQFKKVTSQRKYKIVRSADNMTLAVAKTEWAYISLQQYLPRRIPAELRNAFMVVNEEDEP